MNEIYTTLVPLITEILRAVIAIVFSAIIIPWVVRYAIPWLKEKRIYDFVKKLVRAAEKLGEVGTIDKSSKLDYVISILEKKGIEVDAEMRAMIESAVGDLDDELSHNMLSLIDAINRAEDAAELCYDEGKITVTEPEPEADDEEITDAGEPCGACEVSAE